jgi:O-antigen/teichoic acid export membrane protein
LKQASNYIKNILGFGRGHERTNRAKKNIAASFIIKGINIILGLALVPLTINYLSPTKYGIWITLTSLVAWFGFFDVGLGNGLRNRFAEAIAKGNQSLAKTYVSTTYAMLIIIIGFALVLFYIVNNFLDWGLILNTGADPLLNHELSRLAIVVFASFGMTLVLNLILVILIADQRPAKSSLLDLIGKSLSLLFIYILTRVKSGSLLSLGLVYCTVTPLVLAVSTIWFFNKKYRVYRPSFKAVNFVKAKDLFNLGFRFFVIQLTAILLYQTNNMIIAQLFGPAMVTTYNVAFKYFGVLLIGFMIIVSPFWSAFTEAWEKQDIAWIAGIMKKLRKIWFLIVVCGVIMLSFSGFIYRVWIGNNFAVPFCISILSLGWILINAWNGIFSHFLNGVGKIKLQLYFGTSAAIINIPLALFLGKQIGISGVLLANVLVMLSVAWIGPLQYSKIINKRATGIWNQ